MPINLSINSSATVKDLNRFIKNSVHKAGFSKVIVGLSGGIDSSVVCLLAVQSVGVENVIAAIFPCGDLDQEGESHAQLLIERLKIPAQNIIKIDIKPIADSIYDVDQNMDRLRRGNIIARVRMLLLFDQARKYKALVMGTENKTEYLLGYFTRFGDEASDIEPIRRLYKTQVRFLAKHIGVPEQIIQKPPAAGLWENQTDEGEFGFSYKDADNILHLYVDFRKKQEEIEKMGFKKETVEKVISRLEANEFKHKLPYLFSTD